MIEFYVFFAYSFNIHYRLVKTQLTMNKPKFYYIIGLAGVDSRENHRAQLTGKLFEWPMLFLALWMFLLWYMDVTGYVDKATLKITDILVWGFFIVEMLVMTILVDKKIRYVSSNWMNLIVIIFGMQVLWGDMQYIAAVRVARLVVIVVLYLSIFDSILIILARKKLGITLIISFLTIFIAGIVISVFDPGISDPWEGLWWAWVTVTTVGYGDVVPTSAAGRIIAGLLILMGVGIFSMLTASFSAFLVSRDSDELDSKEERALRILNRIDDKLEDIDRRLERLERQKARKDE